MKTTKLGNSQIEVPRIAIGCMRIDHMSNEELSEFVEKAMSMGASFFDHADIYGGGKCEKKFGEVIGNKPSLRDQMFLQTKCGIVPGNRFDFSKEHILKSVDNSLKNLQTDRLDMLLLHRPDALVEPDEVAEAFDELERSGKVLHFGVSNHKPMQIQLLQKSLKQPILVNQMQFSITNCTMVSSGINANMRNDSATDRDDSVLDFCRLNDITIQAWSPFQYGMFEGVFLGNEKFPELNQEIDKLANQYGVSNTTIAIAWILRHPANIVPVTGTTNIKRLEDCVKACEITLTREEWYEIYRAAGNILP